MTERRHETPAALGLGLLACMTAMLAGCGDGTSSTASSMVVPGDSETAVSVPACSWPLNTSGRAPAAQVGLIKCYLRALAHHSLIELAPLVATASDGPTTISVRDLRHATDAADGIARAKFISNFIDPYNASVLIRFHDGVMTTVVMDAMNPMLPARQSWRLDIGSTPLPHGMRTPPPTAAPG